MKNRLWAAHAQQCSRKVDPEIIVQTFFLGGGVSTRIIFSPLCLYAWVGLHKSYVKSPSLKQEKDREHAEEGEAGEEQSGWKERGR